MVYDLTHNIAKGRVAEFGALAGANDAFIAIPIETTGIETAATMLDYADVAALLAGTSNEQTTMGRKTMASLVVTVDNTNNRTDVDAADITWTAATGNAISAVELAFDYDTTAGTDANIVPCVLLDAVATPAGGDITLQFNVAGFFRAS
jgi:hypothetical protein